MNLQVIFLRLIKGLLSALLLIIAVSGVTSAADGDLDAAFNPSLGVNGGTARGTVVQPDGKIIIYGGFTFTTPAFSQGITRVNADGTRDATFNPGSGALVAGGGSIAINSAVLQPDGKIIIAGNLTSFNGTARNRLARLNADGSLDAAFVPPGPNEEINRVALQTDGKILIGGNFTAYGAAARNRYARLNADGSLDESFNTGAGANDIVYEINQQPDGKIFVGGTFTTIDGGNLRGIVRLNANGSVDGSFATNFQQLPLIYQIRRQPDGKILIGGFFTPFIGIQRNGIARLNDDGSLDATFNSGAGVGFFGVFTIALQTDGKVLIGGSFTDYNGITRQRLARLNADGALDATFDTALGANNAVQSLVVQPDGKILVAGNFTTYKNVARQGIARLSNTVSVNNPALRIADFDGDGKTDASVFRSGTWYINPSSNPTAFAPQGFYATQFGLSTDKLVPADYDGDGKTDIAVWREADFAYFYILNSSNNTFRGEQFGRTGDNPSVVGNWDADGKADLAVYRNGAAGGQSYVYYRPSAQPTSDFETIYWGTGGDEVLRGDFDGDGRLDAAVFRSSNQIWYIRQSSNGTLRSESWGLASDKKVSGDFDGDGRTDLAVFRPSSGIWYLRQSSDGQFRAVQYGSGTDKLVAADYDGDGKTDFAVWRNGTYYILQSTSSQSRAISFGASTDIPVAAAFVQ